ncbi:hypothetical protein BD779DRAFT_1472385 [Infundibulicybe gibba]|nr:hypothetical protein BD779DRAFT_1472385 [Infundibulicybe gibba]
MCLGQNVRNVKRGKRDLASQGPGLLLLNALGARAESRGDSQGAAHSDGRIDVKIQLPDVNPQLDEGAFERGWPVRGSWLAAELRYGQFPKWGGIFIYVIHQLERPRQPTMYQGYLTVVAW